MAAAGALLAAIACADGADEDRGGAPEDAAPTGVLDLPVDARLAARLASFSPLPPVPPDPTNRVADDPSAALLGQALFFDERLSANGRVSCATCHDPDRGFTDGRELAFGLAEGRRKTPTLWNAAHHRWLTWDGRADSLWMQALDPIEDPTEMGATRTDVARIVRDDEDLRALYEASLGALPEALPEGLVTARPARPGEAADAPLPAAYASYTEAERAAIDEVYVGAGKALAAYQRRLVRGDAPFDRFVAALETRDPEGLGALGGPELRGLEIFFGKGSCTLCHSGPNFSDSEFHNNALPALDRGEPDDAGRYDGAAVVAASPFNAAGPFSDAPDGNAARAVRTLRQSSETYGEFRTPSLRNLAGRAPFMHQGQFEDLAAVLEFYSTLEGQTLRSHHQEQILRPVRLERGELSDLAAFLGSLEGDPLDSRRLAAPTRDELRAAASAVRNR